MGIVILFNLIGLSICILSMESGSMLMDGLALFFAICALLCVYKVYLEDKRKENNERWNRR